MASRPLAPGQREGKSAGAGLPSRGPSHHDVVVHLDACAGFTRLDPDLVGDGSVRAALGLGARAGGAAGEEDEGDGRGGAGQGEAG